MSNNNEPLVLTIDYGTQSVRAMLFDKEGNDHGKLKISFVPYYSKKVGWAEQSPDLYWEKLCEATQGLKAKVGNELWDRIEAVAVTTIRDTVVIVDKDGKPLRPVILWLDQREIENPEKHIPSGLKALLKAVKMYETALTQCRTTPCNWVHENEPKVWEKMYKYLLFSGYINLKMTGEFKDSIANQIGHIPFDYKNKAWNGPHALTSPLYDITEKYMPELVETGNIIGRITEEAAKDTGIKVGMAVVASGSDKGCETLGSGCFDSRGASLSFGTTATVQMTVDRYIEPEMFVPSYPAVLPGKYNPEIEIFRGYWMLSWFKQEFAQKEVKEAEAMGISAEELLNLHLKDVPAGCDGLILQPYWTPGIRHPNARGAILGFSDCHTRAHLYRAIIEGIGFGLYDGLLAIEKKAKTTVEFLTVSGGGSQSEEICQITANLMGKPVRKAQTYETSSLGAAITAFTALRVYQSFEEAAKVMVRHTKTYEPNMKEHEFYLRLYKDIYKNIYPNNKKLYDKIKKIQEEYNV
ncbi:MAG: FGGY-family carbohydrate kinase [Clostridia bacterium]